MCTKVPCSRAFLPLVLWLIVTLSSCAGIQHIYKGASTPIKKNELSRLNGLYEDHGQPDSSAALLWAQLKRGSYPSRWDTSSQRELSPRGYYQISIVAVSPKKLELSLLHNGKPVKKPRMLHGRIRNGNFCAQRLRVIPFFPLIFLYDTRSVRMGLTDNGLFVDSKDVVFGIFIAAGGSQKYSQSGSYVRANQ